MTKNPNPKERYADLPTHQERHHLDRLVRFVAFQALKSVTTGGKIRTWIIEGYGPSLAAAHHDLKANITQFRGY